MISSIMTLLLLVHVPENVFKTMCFDPPTLVVGKDLVIYCILI